jgi:hypothetical protein
VDHRVARKKINQIFPNGSTTVSKAHVCQRCGYSSTRMDTFKKYFLSKSNQYGCQQLTDASDGKESVGSSAPSTSWKMLKKESSIHQTNAAVLQHHSTIILPISTPPKNFKNNNSSSSSQCLMVPVSHNSPFNQSSPLHQLQWIVLLKDLPRRESMMKQELMMLSAVSLIHYQQIGGTSPTKNMSKSIAFWL